MGALEERMAALRAGASLEDVARSLDAYGELNRESLRVAWVLADLDGERMRLGLGQRQP